MKEVFNIMKENRHSMIQQKILKPIREAGNKIAKAMNIVEKVASNADINVNNKCFGYDTDIDIDEDGGEALLNTLKA